MFPRGKHLVHVARPDRPKLPVLPPGWHGDTEVFNALHGVLEESGPRSDGPLKRINGGYRDSGTHEEHGVARPDGLFEIVYQ